MKNHIETDMQSIVALGVISTWNAEL